jgi:hypothetical protein
MFLDAAGHNITLLHLLVSKVNVHKDVMNLFCCDDKFLRKKFSPGLIYNTVYKNEREFTKKESNVIR